MRNFKDNFSSFSAIYARYRPVYPAALYQYLQSQTTEHQLAWDCGTGNGQSAIQLADYYEQVYATDPSEQQISNASSNPNIEYKVEKAEDCSLPDKSVDLITVAQAMHWFNFDEFYRQVKRVLKDDGILAVWTYTLPRVNDDIDSIIQEFHDETVGEFWAPENKLVALRYTSIPFPFTIIPSPDFVIRKNISLHDLLGHISSWSATQKYMAYYGEDPIFRLKEKLKDIWSEPDMEREVCWDLVLKLGKLP